MKTTPTTAKPEADLPVSTRRRVLEGVAVRRSGDKTVAVAVSRVVRHPLYRKRRALTVTHLAHDEQNAVAIGDRVTIQESRPLSARKRWVVIARASN